MQIVKMFAALLMAAGAMQMLGTHARAEALSKPEVSVRLDMPACAWKHPYRYRYHYRYRPNIPGQHPRAPRPRRKVDPND